MLCGLRANSSGLEGLAPRTAAAPCSPARCRFVWGQGCLPGDAGLCCLARDAGVDFSSAAEILGVAGFVYAQLLDDVDAVNEYAVAANDVILRLTNNTFSLAGFKLRVCSTREKTVSNRLEQAHLIAKSNWEQQQKRKHKHKRRILAPLR